MRRKAPTDNGELYRNKEYERIARRVIKENDDLTYIRENPVAFVVLSSTKEKKNRDHIIFGECQKVDDKYKWYVPFDFQIVIYDANIVDFTEEQLAILIHHELRHIGIDNDADEVKYYVVQHDVEDFDAIIEKYGLHWGAKK